MGWDAVEPNPFQMQLQALYLEVCQRKGWNPERAVSTFEKRFDLGTSTLSKALAGAHGTLGFESIRKMMDALYDDGQGVLTRHEKEIYKARLYIARTYLRLLDAYREGNPAIVLTEEDRKEYWRHAEDFYQSHKDLFSIEGIPLSFLIQRLLRREGVYDGLKNELIGGWEMVPAIYDPVKSYNEIPKKSREIYRIYEQSERISTSLDLFGRLIVQGQGAVFNRLIPPMSNFTTLLTIKRLMDYKRDLLHVFRPKWQFIGIMITNNLTLDMLSGRVPEISVRGETFHRYFLFDDVRKHEISTILGHQLDKSLCHDAISSEYKDEYIENSPQYDIAINITNEYFGTKDTYCEILINGKVVKHTNRLYGLRAIEAPVRVCVVNVASEPTMGVMVKKFRVIPTADN